MVEVGCNIVVSLTILVVRFWGRLPAVAQIAFIFSVPAAFYLFGWTLRRRLSLPRAGIVLTAVGALLVAVDFVAVYQFGNLAAAVDLYWYWFATALLCTALYALTAWRIPVTFMGYLAGIGVINVVVALTLACRLPQLWIAASVAAAALLLLGLSFVLQRSLRRPLAEGQVDRRRGLGVASRWLGALLLPASQLAVPFLYAVYGSSGDLGVRLALPATFALATLGYGLLAWRAPLPIWPHAVAWSAAVACLLSLLVLRMPDEWLLAALAGLALVYTIIGRGLRRRPGYAWPAYLAAQGMALLSAFCVVTILVLLDSVGGIVFGQICLISHLPTESARTRMIIESSGNALSDLGFEPGEAAILQMRAKLMSDLRMRIEASGMTQTEAAHKLGIAQSRVSDLMRGKWEKFRLEMLITLEARLGR